MVVVCFVVGGVVWDPKTTNGKFRSSFRVNEIMGERWACSPWLVVAGFCSCMRAGHCL